MFVPSTACQDFAAVRAGGISWSKEEGTATATVLILSFYSLPLLSVLIRAFCYLLIGILKPNKEHRRGLEKVTEGDRRRLFKNK